VFEGLKGVKNCEVDFANNSAVVIFDDKKLDSQNIVDVLKKKTSYKVKVQTENKGENKVDSI
jgi:copper chaperone CopZ